MFLKDPAIQISDFSNTCTSGSTLMSTQGTQSTVKQKIESKQTDMKQCQEATNTLI